MRPTILALVLISAGLTIFGAILFADPLFGMRSSDLTDLLVLAMPLYGALVLVGLYVLMFQWLRRGEAPSRTELAVAHVVFRRTPLALLMLPLAIPPIARQSRVWRFALAAAAFWVLPAVAVSSWQGVHVMRIRGMVAAGEAIRSLRQAASSLPLEERCAKCRDIRGAERRYVRDFGPLEFDPRDPCRVCPRE